MDRVGEKRYDATLGPDCDAGVTVSSPESPRACGLGHPRAWCGAKNAESGDMGAGGAARGVGGISYDPARGRPLSRFEVATRNGGRVG